MIRKIKRNELPDCVQVICESFRTVADEFGFTIENAPRFTAFATTEERLVYQLEQEQRLMFAYYDDGRMVGYYSLLKQNEEECELNNLCVLEQYRHKKIGEQLLEHAFAEAEKMGCSQMNIGIVEENVKLRKWYEAHGAEHIRTEKYDFFPFTCGYMKFELHENPATQSWLCTVNAIEDISWIYENGEFQFSRWNQYMDLTLPGHKEIFINDMKKTIQSGGFTFDQDILPILNQVVSDAGKRNRAIESFENATKGLEKNIMDTFGQTVNVNIILYLGLCNGAGWVMKIDNKQYIMLGIEKMIELNWCDLNTMYGLIYHELGHIYQMQYGKFSGNYNGSDRFLWQLFTEGIAMLFEQKLLGDENFFHQNVDAWLPWCDENLKMIKTDFNDDLLTMSYSNQRYFGDWVSYKDHSDVGYYLGARFVQWVNQRYQFDEMICFDILKVGEEWDKYLCL